MKLLVDERDVKFVLYEQLHVEELCKHPRYQDFSEDMFDMAIEQAEKLAEREFYPTNRKGDLEGCRFEEGRVMVPECFHEPYRLYCEGGWLAISDSPEVGGQGFPMSIANACMEFFGAANWALFMYPGLTHGAARLLENYGSPKLKDLYLHKMFSGEWAGTMCLTESGAGTDVGNLRSKASRNPDGTFNISGQKIFISSGMHDLTENIVHMVLARIEGAPKGVKGISIFLVPRLRYDEKGKLVDNDVNCAGIEHKMGIHGSATCALNFGERSDCVGYLLGQENGGMRIMFEMMNEARLFVGMQGLSHAGTAYLHALRYARERLQGAPAERMKDPDSPRVPIIQHPDVRRMLMFMKSSTEGLRALLYLAAYCIDRVRIAENRDEKDVFQGYVDLLIPICKSMGSDLGFRVCETAVQVYGGYGYCCEYPVEQFLRDCKISSIYEGTNGIQALDLVGRKLTLKHGQLFKNAMQSMSGILNKIEKNFHLRELVQIYKEAQESLIQVTKFFALKGMTDEFHIPLLYAKPYLDLCGEVTIGFLLLWQAHLADRRLREIYKDHKAENEAAQRKLLDENRSAAFYYGKTASARFFIHQVLTQVGGKARAIMNNDKSALEIPEYGFALD
ncbi:acyl-CoA dehydrogenase [Desulforhabdus amnigena]|uniref:3-methylmercaptopropionyl-CoA dehydrogenase n=1 Tax=Desulforhabdus amnigena TaxID=40218 RepID=A0A9W6FR31_9BACT|nr:acyl-CoA dehydrogenase [Desulforhabdus amnigena]GLI33122.1 acyl-CoA dehydrogenase [Desulforhabdus amnigena]